MSVVIIGGHDRMVCQYKKICKEHKCKAKVFTQMPAKLSSQIGSPDLIILFTNTVSHKMVKCAVAEAERSKAEVVRSHSSSGNALNEILEKFVNGKKKFTSGAIAERAVGQYSCKDQTKRKCNDNHDRSSKPGDSFCQ